MEVETPYCAERLWQPMQIFPVWRGVFILFFACLQFVIKKEIMFFLRDFLTMQFYKEKVLISVICFCMSSICKKKEIMVQEISLRGFLIIPMSITLLYDYIGT